MPASPPPSTIHGSFVRGSRSAVVQLVDRERRVGVDLDVAGVARLPCGVDDRRRRIELGEQAVQLGGRIFELHVDCRPQWAPSGFLIWADGMIVRISNIEIIGTNRRNRNSSQVNNPSVPM